MLVFFVAFRESYTNLVFLYFILVCFFFLIFVMWFWVTIKAEDFIVRKVEEDYSYLLFHQGSSCKFWQVGF